jgi:hypothetical protein
MSESVAVANRLTETRRWLTAIQIVTDRANTVELPLQPQVRQLPSTQPAERMRRTF